MIPQPIKWVGAILVLGIFVYVAVPMALESFTGSVSVTDSGGLFSSGDDEEELLDDGVGDDGQPDEADADEADAPEGGPDGVAEDDAADGDGADAAEDIPESYVVESGDTLFSIAEALYGDGNRWPEIAEANEIDQTGIRVGQELVIP